MDTGPVIARAAAAPAWTLGAAAVLLVAVLLLGFVHVLQAGVAQGAQRRHTELERDQARWACARLAQRQARSDCRDRLTGPASPPPPAAH